MMQRSKQHNPRVLQIPSSHYSVLHCKVDAFVVLAIYHSCWSDKPTNFANKKQSE